MYFLLPGYFFIPPPFLPFVSCKLRQIFELVSCRILICSINAAKNLFCCSTSPATPMPTPTPLPLPLTLSAEAAEALLLLLPLRHSGVFCPLSLESLSDGFSRQGSLKRNLRKIKKLIWFDCFFFFFFSHTLDLCSDCCRCHRAHLWSFGHAPSRRHHRHHRRRRRHRLRSVYWAAVVNWRNPVLHRCA